MVSKEDQETREVLALLEPQELVALKDHEEVKVKEEGTETQGQWDYQELMV